MNATIANSTSVEAFLSVCQSIGCKLREVLWGYGRNFAEWVGNPARVQLLYAILTLFGAWLTVSLFMTMIVIAFFIVRRILRFLWWTVRSLAVSSPPLWSSLGRLAGFAFPPLMVYRYLKSTELILKTQEESTTSKPSKQSSMLSESSSPSAVVYLVQNKEVCPVVGKVVPEMATNNTPIDTTKRMPVFAFSDPTGHNVLATVNMVKNVRTPTGRVIPLGFLTAVHSYVSCLQNSGDPEEPDNEFFHFISPFSRSYCRIPKKDCDVRFSFRDDQNDGWLLWTTKHDTLLQGSLSLPAAAEVARFRNNHPVTAFMMRKSDGRHKLQVSTGHADLQAAFYFKHLCSTQPGDSGVALYQGGKVVGVHRGALPAAGAANCGYTFRFPPLPLTESYVKEVEEDFQLYGADLTREELKRELEREAEAMRFDDYDNNFYATYKRAGKKVAFDIMSSDAVATSEKLVNRAPSEWKSGFSWADDEESNLKVTAPLKTPEEPSRAGQAVEQQESESKAETPSADGPKLSKSALKKAKKLAQVSSATERCPLETTTESPNPLEKDLIELRKSLASLADSVTRIAEQTQQERALSSKREDVSNRMMSTLSRLELSLKKPSGSTPAAQQPPPPPPRSATTGSKPNAIGASTSGSQ